MTHHARYAAALAAATLCVTLIGPAPAASAEATSPLADAVADALAAAGGSSVSIDTTCGTAGTPAAQTARLVETEPAPAQPLVYATNRIVLRTPAADVDTIPALVHQALSRLDPVHPVQLTVEEPIAFADAPDGPIDPAVPVALDPGGGPAVDVVALARLLHHPEAGISASPDYVLSPSSGSSGMWPNGYPKWTDTLPAPRAATIGAGVDIAVYDTGLPPQNVGNWPPNVARLTNGDVEQLDRREPYGEVDLYFGGHTLGIAGVIATLAPAARVWAARITRPDGLATDTSAARRMANTLSSVSLGGGPDVIVGAFGSPACVSGSGEALVPLGLEAVSEAVWRYGHAILVAASGNRSAGQPIYPAGFDSVLSVGALDTASAGDPWTSPTRTGPVAAFSDYGDWVKAWAPGVGLAVTHVDGLRFEPDGPILTGRAIVDGTSFAAPYLAALIAEQVAARGQSPRTAWLAIEASGARCSVTNGAGVAVALTSMAAAATTRGAPAAGTVC